MMCAAAGPWTVSRWPLAWLLVCGQTGGKNSSNNTAEGGRWQLFLTSECGPLSKTVTACKAGADDQRSWGCGAATAVLAVSSWLFSVLILIAQGLHASLCSWPPAATAAVPPGMSSITSSSCPQGALPATAAAIGQARPQVPLGSPELPVAQPGSVCAREVCSMPHDITSSLQRILMDNQVDDIFTAAATAQRSARPCLQYKSMVSTLPVNIKLPYANHSDIPVIGPLLTDTLEQYVAAVGASSAAGSSVYSNGRLSAAQVHSICFPGCIQLLASIYHVEDPAAAADGQLQATPSWDDSSSPGCSNSSSTSSLSASSHGELAAALLKQVHSKMVDNVSVAASAATNGKSAVTTAIMHIIVGNSFASSTPSAVLAATEPPSPAAAAAAEATAAMPAIRLLCCQPLCLVAGQQQQLTLTLRVAASAVSSAATANDTVLPCRMLAYQQGLVLVDQEATLNYGIVELSVDLPCLSVGVLHVVLMPGRKPTARAALQSDKQQSGTAQLGQQSADQLQLQAAFAPLLLQPLLVLSEAAAVELDTFWQQALGAAPAAVNGGSSDLDAAAVLAASWQGITDLTVDFAYLLQAAAAESVMVPAYPAAGASAAIADLQDSTMQLAEGFRAVLLNLCRYLVACQLWETLAAVAKHVAAAHSTAVASGKQNASANDITVQGISSTGPTEYEPDSKPVKGRDYCGSSSSGHSSGGKDAAALSSAAAAAPQETCSPAFSGAAVAHVSWWHLLCGLPDRQLESLYRATQFRACSGVDTFRFSFLGMLSVVCWLISFFADVKHPFASARSAAWWVSSFIATQAFGTLLPLMVLLLRRNIARAVQDSKRHAAQQQYQQLGPLVASSSVAQSADTRQQQVRDDTAAGALAARETAIYVKAARTKQLLILSWILTLELGNIGIAYKWVAIVPSISRTYQIRSLSVYCAQVITHALKGAMFEVPFLLLVPIMVAASAINGLQNYHHGLRPTVCIAARTIPGCLLALLIAAQQNITGRRRFLQGCALKHEVRDCT